MHSAGRHVEEHIPRVLVEIADKGRRQLKKRLHVVAVYKFGASKDKAARRLVIPADRERGGFLSRLFTLRQFYPFGYGWIVR